MKKYILYSLAALCFASCSSDNDEITQTNTNKDKLTNATITATSSMGDNTTRATWAVDNGNSIVVSFEPSEKMDVFEEGYTTDFKHVFTNTDGDNYQSGNFSGTWHEEGDIWAAVLPSGAATSVTMNASTSTNDYNLVLPNTQTTKSVTNSTTGYTNTYPDQSANIMIAGRSAHGTDASCFLAPVVAYLRFYTPASINTVKVTAEKAIAGTFQTRTSGNEWNKWATWSALSSTISAVTGNANSYKEITVTGVPVTRTINNVATSVCEYVVCVFPTSYPAGTLKITTTSGTVLKTNSNQQDLAAVNLYNLGYISAE